MDCVVGGEVGKILQPRPERAHRLRPPAQLPSIAACDGYFARASGTPLEAAMPQQSGILVAQAAADLVLAASYLAVLCVLAWFLRRRPDLVRHHWLLGLLIGCFLA